MSDVQQYGQEERLRLIRNYHIIRPGHPGVECLADFEVDNVFLTVSDDGWIMCPACGNELGHQSQLMLTVWDSEPDMDWFSKKRTTAHLEFIGPIGAGPSGPKAPY
jgi:hypothetical protein